MKRWTMVGVVGLMLMMFATPGVQAANKTLYVGTCKGASPYQTIQSAVNAVNDDGFTIYVCPGTYNETVIVQNKEELTIRNYVVKNQPAPLIDSNGSDGIYIIDSEEVTIRGLRVTNAFFAIYASNSPKTEVRNTIISTSYAGIVFDSSSDKSEAQQNTISGSNGYEFGIGIGFNTNITVKQNTISGFDIGIYATAADKLKIESNSVTNADSAGIALLGVTGAKVRKNTTNFSEYGIFLGNSTNNTVSENTAKSNTTAGVFVDDDSTNNSLKKNLLQGNSTDAVDESTGSGTAGTANSWLSNKCDTSVPGDLCGSAATQRRAPPAPPTLPSWPFHH